MRRLGIVAVGLALVVGIIVGGMVGNLFGATAQHTSAASATGTGCYTNWNSADCAAGYTAVSTGEWTSVSAYSAAPTGDFQAGAIVCAEPRSDQENLDFSMLSSTRHQRLHTVSHEPCAICCATGPTVVGGVAELPAVAGTSGSGMGGATYAVLAGAAAGVLAFAVLAALTVKRRGVR